MRSVNKVILIGNVTRDPELRQTQSGQAVCTFGLATNREWVTSDSRKKSSAEYHEVVAWAQLADICSKYVRKGKLLYVEGYLKTRSWDTPEGIRKFKTEVVIQDMIMLEKRKDGEGLESELLSSPMGDYDDYYDDDPSDNVASAPIEEAPAITEKPVEAEAEEVNNEPVEAPQEEAAPQEEKKESSLIDADLGL